MNRPFLQRAATILCLFVGLSCAGWATTTDTMPEQQLTHAGKDHTLTNANAFSPDSLWIYYDTRDISGDFNGLFIERVRVDDGAKVQTLYTSKNGAFCGVVTANPVDGRAVFIHGPENPDAAWTYGFSRRHGVLVSPETVGASCNLDAENYAAPFAKGALRGGSHVHMFAPDGQWASYTYDDEVLTAHAKAQGKPVPGRNIAVSAPAPGGVKVNRNHPRNNDGDYFSAVVSRITLSPKPGSDEISRACEEGWVGANGFVKTDGTRQKRALAFQGTVVAADGKPHIEVFLLELPDDLTQVGEGAIEGTQSELPAPPKGVVQKRLTYTQDRKYRGVQGVRHWLRASPDGSQIAFLMRDDDGVSQIWTVSPNGGAPRQMTHLKHDVGSCFTWSPDGQWIAFASAGAILKANAATGETVQLTAPRADKTQDPIPYATVFSPDGKLIAYNRLVPTDGEKRIQIFVVGANAKP